MDQNEQQVEQAEGAQPEPLSQEDAQIAQRKMESDFLYRGLPALFRELGEVFPDNAYKKVKYGSREFITLDAYSIIERLTRVAGPCGIGWGWRNLVFTAYPDSVSCIGTFWIIDPHTGERWEVPAVGDGAIIKGSSTAEAAKKAQTNMLSKAVSFIGVGTIDLYQGKMLDCPLTDRAGAGTAPSTVPPPAAPTAPAPAAVAAPQPPQAAVPAAAPPATPPQAAPGTIDPTVCPGCGKQGQVSNYGGYWCPKDTGCGMQWGKVKYYITLDELKAQYGSERVDGYLQEQGMMDAHMKEWKDMEGEDKDRIQKDPEGFKNAFHAWAIPEMPGEPAPF